MNIDRIYDGGSVMNYEQYVYHASWSLRISENTRFDYVY